MSHAPPLLSLCERGVDHALSAGASQAEVYGTRQSQVEATLQKNDLDQVSTSREVTLGVRVVVEGRLGFATSNRVGDLAEVAAQAVALARVAPPDPLNALPEPAPLPEHDDVVDDAIAGLGPGELARRAMDLLALVRGLDPRVNVDSAELGTSDTERAIATSTGIRARHRALTASGGLLGMAIDGDDVGSAAFGGDAVCRLDALDPALEHAARRFVEHCVGALGAGTGKSFRGTILVPPDTVAEFLIDDLLDSLCADVVRQGRSAFADRLGQRIADSRLTLIEEGAGLAGLPLAPFDREGQPRQRRTLVENGVLRSFLFDSYEARAAGTRTTAHAQGGAASLPTVGSACLSLAAGDVPMASLRDLERGIVVTRFSGSTNPVTGDFSGVVKGGFLVERGAVRPVRETMIAGNLWRCLQQISGISRETETFFGTARYPAIRIEDVSITAG